MAAHQLMAGDHLRSHDGRWVALEAVEGDQEAAPVYNLRVAEYHTYFVGDAEWGFSVWAHNSDCPVTEGRTGPIVTHKGDNRPLDEVFEQGLRSWADTNGVPPNWDVMEHVEGIPKSSLGVDSGYVPTSPRAEDAAAWGNYVYKVHLDDGIDVDQWYRATQGRPYYADPTRAENEILGIGSIPAVRIEGAYPKVNPRVGDELGPLIPNPKFKLP